MGVQCSHASVGLAQARPNNLQKQGYDTTCMLSTHMHYSQFTGQCSHRLLLSHLISVDLCWIGKEGCVSALQATTGRQLSGVCKNLFSTAALLKWSPAAEHLCMWSNLYRSTWISRSIEESRHSWARMTWVMAITNTRKCGGMSLDRNFHCSLSQTTTMTDERTLIGYLQNWSSFAQPSCAWSN